MTTKRYIRDVELSEASGIPLPTLRADRQRDRRIPFIKIGRSCWYDSLTVFDDIAEKFGVGGQRQPGVTVTTSKPIRKAGRIKQVG